MFSETADNLMGLNFRRRRIQNLHLKINTKTWNWSKPAEIKW